MAKNRLEDFYIPNTNLPSIGNEYKVAYISTQQLPINGSSWTLIDQFSLNISFFENVTFNVFKFTNIIKGHLAELDNIMSIRLDVEANDQVLTLVNSESNHLLNKSLGTSRFLNIWFDKNSEGNYMNFVALDTESTTNTDVASNFENIINQSFEFIPASVTFKVYAKNSSSEASSSKFFTLLETFLGSSDSPPPPPLINGLNQFSYLPGESPSIQEFENRIGFGLLNGFKNEDTIHFDNVDYHIGDGAFTEETFAGIICQATSVGFGSFENCQDTSIKNFPELLTAGNESFARNRGTLNLPKLISIGLRGFEYNQPTGIINADALTSVGHAALAFNSGSISIKSLTPIGANADYNSLIQEAQPSSVFNVNIANQTNNSGQPDGDIQEAINGGATVNYFNYP